MRALARHRPIGSRSPRPRPRVALAKAMLNTPAVLLLDEPTASLDPDTADWVRGYLERYRERTNATILLASHNMAEVERLCDRTILLLASTYAFAEGSIMSVEIPRPVKVLPSSAILTVASPSASLPPVTARIE